MDYACTRANAHSQHLVAHKYININMIIIIIILIINIV